jgi:acetyl esterase
VLHPDIQPILDEMNAAAGRPDHELPINEARASHVAETAWLCGEGEPVAEVRNTTARGPGGDIPVRIYVPDDPHGVVAYIHGGGWIMGRSPATTRR